MKIYTRKGDEGQTSLLGGTRVPKHHLRIEAYGAVDELNVAIGALADHLSILAYHPLVRQIQHNLFVLGSQLANDPENSQFVLPELPEDAVQQLEDSIDEMNDWLTPLKNFVLPGGCPANSAAHLARTVCRRAERNVTALAESGAVEPQILAYLNRLSDWLFMLARRASQLTGAEEIIWKP